MAGTATNSQCAEVTLKNLIPKLQIKLSECQRKDIVIIIATSSNLRLYIVLNQKNILHQAKWFNYLTNSGVISIRLSD